MQKFHFYTKNKTFLTSTCMDYKNNMLLASTDSYNLKIYKLKTYIFANLFYKDY